MPKQLTLRRNHSIMMVNPYIPDTMSDARAVIYGAAFVGSVRAGLIPAADVNERVQSVVLRRPQLSHIDGRPC